MLTCPQNGKSSDAAGEVVKLGPKATRFAIGHRVSPIFHLTHLVASLQPRDFSFQLGSTQDSVFREYGVFNEQFCVEVPSNLSYREAASLPCAAVTAWNALYGGSRKLMPGDIVLTQGTGGVSISALQFAKMSGAQVIATTSAAEKAERLRAESADHVINYEEDPQ
ncbi:putative quinone oxidoreductase [Aspergillus affinis]|uniref:putative quinone oxidoreductase n=1 Tax=Aspergillus affinis TaxID=1070780 RepID=UPI0022FE4667|nr:putative quinone oxidoreductase [Aspergillus affinis]KAI9043190.1 putative quinone oxidoreductase [Aspergillus affinis]